MSTIKLNTVNNFDTLAVDQASNVLYNQVVPACEQKGVKLSRYGNNAGQGALQGVEKYNQSKAQHQLFDVARVQRAFSALDNFIGPLSTYKVGSYGLKHSVERYQGEYISNGDLIAAMLLKGYAARFGKQGEANGVNCEFKAKVLIDVQNLA